jgi:hypothetical protein
VVDERRALRHPLSLFGVVGVGAQRQGGLVDRLVAGLEGLVLDVADQPALVGIGHLGRPLDRGHPADHRLDLDVLEVRLAGERAERVRGI